MYDVSLKRKWDAYSLRQTIIIEKEKVAKAEKELEEFKEEAKIEKETNEQKILAAVKNLIQDPDFSNERIANTIEVSVDFVEKVRKSLISNID